MPKTKRKPVSAQERERRRLQREGKIRVPELGHEHEQGDAYVRAPYSADEAVVVAWMSGGNNAHQFTSSLVELAHYDSIYGQWWFKGGQIDMINSPRVAEGRTQVVERFLTEPRYGHADWLLMIDDDMVFDADLIERLMGVASFPERPIVGALCFAGRHYGKQWPTIYEMYQEETTWGVRPVMVYPEDAIVKCGGTGAAVLLVHRQVYMGMAAAPWNQWIREGQRNPYPWFVEGVVTSDGAPLGEDIAFCRKATLLGIPIHVHTGIKTGHMKSAALTEATFRGQMLEDEAAIARKIDDGEFEVVENDLWVPEQMAVLQ